MCLDRGKIKRWSWEILGNLKGKEIIKAGLTHTHTQEIKRKSGLLRFEQNAE